MCVFACERLRLQHVYSIWLNYSEFVSMPYEEHKLQHSLWIIMKHNTLSLALTFGNNHSNFIIEWTKICFYWTCLCALKSFSLYPMLTLYFTFTVCAGRIASNYSLTELNTETQLLFMRGRENALLLGSQCLLFLVCGVFTNGKLAFAVFGAVWAHFEFDHW